MANRSFPGLCGVFGEFWGGASLWRLERPTRSLRSHQSRRSGCAVVVEFMPMGSEREEELQEECGVPQLETRLQHGSEHVCSPQVWTLAGRCSPEQTEKPPVCHQELSAAVLMVFLSFLPCSLCCGLAEQPERPGGLSSDDCHSEPRPGPQRSQQLLHTEVGQKTHVLIARVCVSCPITPL